MGEGGAGLGVGTEGSGGEGLLAGAVEAGTPAGLL